MSSRRESQPITLDDVRDWYEAVRESILAHRTWVLGLFRGGVPGANSRFFGLSLGEVEEVFEGQLSELESATVMTLMSSAEAAIRVDYQERVRNKFKDILSQNYIALQKSLTPVAQMRPPFDEEILESLKNSGIMANHFIGDFRDSLRLRHWLAHGRYWTVTLGRRSYRPDDVYRIAHALLAALPP